MQFSKFFSSGKLALSYELFPPKTVKGEENLYANLQQLMEFSPDFVTCTYGAGGSTQAKTLDIVGQVKERFAVPVVSHLTVVGSTVAHLQSYLERARQIGVAGIVALRGDPPLGDESFRPAVGGLRYANELVELIRREFDDFGILVAGYPETHREAPDPQTDLENLKRKVDAGADVVVTQLFYDNQDFFRFRDRCVQLGIDVPIVPGILPITSLPQIERITSLCGAKLPARLVDRLRERDTSEWHFEAGVEWAIEQTRDLIEGGVPGLHFYVLNQSPATLRILRELRAESTRG